MRNLSKDKPFLQAIRGKVIAASLLACLAIVMALGITYFSFRGLLGTVEELSSPNEKLRILNIFFQRLTQLDQQQRADAISNPQKPFDNFLAESKTLLLTIDTLRSMDWQDSQQMVRLDAMEKILTERDQLFLSYLKVRSDFIYNRNFTHRLDTLSDILSTSHAANDSSVQSAQKKTVTTIYLPAEKVEKKDTRSFFSKLFSKKKEEEKPAETRVEVKEELSVVIDTLAIAKQDSAIVEVGKIMKSLEQDHRQLNRNMIQKELNLINANTILINQLLGILHHVEKEEVALMHNNNAQAIQLVNTSIQRIGLVILVFFLGVVLLVFLILTDVSRSNYYRNQLVKAKDEAEQLSQVKQRFLANMSHEIRTPLQSILGFSEQLKQKTTPDPEALEAIHNSSEHLLHIVNEVLDFSRIESGKLTLNREVFSLTKVIDEVSAGIRIQAFQHGLDLSVEVNSKEVQLVGDAFRLRQILYNLLGNAVKFTEHGIVKLVVHTNESDGRLRCEFQVIDTGIGMDPKDIDRVFQQFEQVSASINHQYGGTGLGLTIVKKLVEAQQGKLQVVSIPGKGSTFTVVLTFDKAHEQQNTVLNAKHNNGPFSGKIILVDDDPLIVRLCSVIFQKHGFEYITFQDSEKALQFSDYDDISLIFLDIRMPNVNGLELCQAMRKKAKQGTRIVALTAHVLPQERSSLTNAGFDDVFTKPFREQELVDFIGLPAVTDNKETSIRDYGMDLSSLRQMTMGDESLLQSIVFQFAKETEADMLQADQYALTANYAGMREIIHKLAGRTGQMGMDIISADLKKIEIGMNAGRELPGLIPQIQKAFENIKDVLMKIPQETA